MSTTIEVKNLVKRYKNATENAVDGVSFSVDEGEFFAVLGPNGAGKTTTVSVLATTLEKTTGKVFVAGYDLDKNPAEIRRVCGIVFQGPSLDNNLTAEENVRFHASLYGVASYRPFYSWMPLDYRNRVRELAEMLQIEEQIFKPIKALSGGMKRKFELVRSLMHQPRILFLDEPTTGLDPQGRRKLWQYLKNVRKESRTTMVLTTHYLEEAEDADRVAIVNHGRIAAIGTPTEIKQKLTDQHIEIDAAPADRRRLLQNLSKIGVEPESDEIPYRIAINGSSGRSLQEIICVSGVNLTTIEVHKPTLEEAYLKLIADNQ